MVSRKPGLFSLDLFHLNHVSDPLEVGLDEAEQRVVEEPRRGLLSRRILDAVRGHVRARIQKTERRVVVLEVERRILDLIGNHLLGIVAVVDDLKNVLVAHAMGASDLKNEVAKQTVSQLRALQQIDLAEDVATLLKEAVKHSVDLAKHEAGIDIATRMANLRRLNHTVADAVAADEDVRTEKALKRLAAVVVVDEPKAQCEVRTRRVHDVGRVHEALAITLQLALLIGESEVQRSRLVAELGEKLGVADRHVAAASVDAALIRLIGETVELVDGQNVLGEPGLVGADVSRHRFLSCWFVSFSLRLK